MTQTTLNPFEPVNGLYLHELHLSVVPPSFFFLSFPLFCPTILFLSFFTPLLPHSIYPLPPSLLTYVLYVYLVHPILCSHLILPTLSLFLHNISPSLLPSKFSTPICLALFTSLPTVSAPLSHFFLSIPSCFPSQFSTVIAFISSPLHGQNYDSFHPAIV